MSDEFDSWIREIKAVEREYFAVRFSVDRSLQQVRQDPGILTGDLRVREIQRAEEFLEATYIIRLFAEFETALRSFSWMARRGPPPSKTRDLIESVAAQRGDPVDDLRNAHSVRRYRNILVHKRTPDDYRNNRLPERTPDANPISISEARGYLCVYFSFLPRRW